MKRFTTLLAWRYVRGTAREKSIATMTRVCFAGIFIGSAALALVMAIMNGFETVTHQKIQGIHAQAMLRNHGLPIPIESVSTIIETEFPEVTTWAPNTVRQLLIQSPETGASNMVFIKGIEPEKEHHVSALSSKIVDATQEKKTVPATVGNNRILIGKKLADSLGVSPGDELVLAFMPEQKIQRKRVAFETHTVTVGGLFSTGIEEFDTSMVFGTLSLVESLFPEARPTELALRFAPRIDTRAIMQRLHNRLGMQIMSWKDLYPALVSALTLEKYAMFFILALIVLVASMNIFSLLFMQITQKRGDIAILKAMGMPDEQIPSIFLQFGVTLSLLATLSGLACAAGISWLLQHYPFIELPDVYYVTYLPAHLEWHLVLIVFVTIMAISWFASWLPARRTRTLSIANVLRFEA